MDKYFAAKPSDQVASELMRKVENYYNYIRETHLLQIWRRSYENYYKTAYRGGRMVRTGEQGEYTTLNVNHFRNVLQHLTVMTTSQRPAFEPRATNSDYKSAAQTILAVGLLDYYMREKKLERFLKQAVEDALVFGEGFVRVEWDATSGKQYSVNPETGAPIQEGDIKYINLTPVDLIRDYTKDSANHHEWMITRSYKNRYTLAAKYPEIAERILAVPSKVDTNDIRFVTYNTEETDDIAVYEFYHIANEALPQGRVVVFLDDDTVLLDGPLPYRELPVYRVAPSEQSGTCFGYTVAYDLLPIQEAIDSLYSTIITNQSAFGVQNILLPKGADINPVQLGGGLNVIEYDGKVGKPESLNLTHTPAEIFNFVGQLEQKMETLSGVNSVARGQPEASLKSGAALALVASQAIQFSMGLQQSYTQILEDVGTATINILRDFATVPRIATIAGKSNRPLMKEFTGDDLDQINRVTVDMGNPLSRTTAGKVNIAEALMQNQMIKTPQQYIQVMTTGRLEPMIESEQAELMLIRSENEKLSEGQSTIVVVTDNHALHIQEHKVVLASPEARSNPKLVAETTAHLQEHINMLKGADPILLQLLGQTPIAPPAPPQGQAPQVGQAMDATSPLMQQAGAVQQPQMPTIAGTDQQYTPGQ